MIELRDRGGRSFSIDFFWRNSAGGIMWLSGYAGVYFNESGSYHIFIMKTIGRPTYVLPDRDVQPTKKVGHVLIPGWGDSACRRFVVIMDYSGNSQMDLLGRSGYEVNYLTETAVIITALHYFAGLGCLPRGD